MPSHPDSLVLRTVTRAVARHVDLPESSFDVDTNLRAELGLDALDLVLIVTRVEEELAIDVSLPRLEYVRSIADLAALIEEGDEPPTLRDRAVWGPEDAHAN